MRIFYLVLVFIIFYSSSSLSNEGILESVKKNININKPNNKVTVWIKNQWEDTKSSQKEGWEDGKRQLIKNQQQLKNISTSIKKSALGIGEFIQSIYGVKK